MHEGDHLYQYLYGLRAECAQVLAQVGHVDYLYRRNHPSLEAARVCSEGATAHTHGAYGGLGRAYTTLSTDYLIQMEQREKKF